MLTWLAVGLLIVGAAAAVPGILRASQERRLGGAVAACAAVQRDAHTARLLGARPADAAALAGAYWRNVYPLMPDGYRSGDCRPGGPLDEGLADAPWLASVSS